MKNRELKFRIWNGTKMEHNIMVGFLGTFYVQGMDEKDSASMSPMNTKYYDNIIPMQFTGMKDKNGKEIYEGDILKYPDADNGYVRFDYGWAIQYSEVYSHDMPQYYCDNLEIIGNIYENAGLLAVTPNNTKPNSH